MSIHQFCPLEAAKPYSEVLSCYCGFHHKLIEKSEHLLIDARDDTSPTSLGVLSMLKGKSNLSDEIDLVLALGETVFDFPPGFL